MRRISVTMVMTVAVCMVAAVSAMGQDRAELEVDHALTFEFETPHTDWAQPYAGDTTRVLFFTDGRGTNPRECVELMQRFDIEGEAVFWARIVDSAETHWHGGEIGEQRMLELLEQDWDCYVFLGLALDNMSPEQQFKVLQPVTEGAGLVFVGSNDERVLTDENQITDLPPILAPGPVGDAYTVGQGRGIRLPARPEIGYYEGWEVDYDYWSERLGRAVLWAAGHEPQMVLTASAGPGEFAWDATKTLTVDARGEPVGDNPRIRSRVRMAGGPEVELPQRPLPERAFSLQVGSLPAGEWHLDAWVVSDAGVETWTTRPFTVTSDVSVSEVALEQGWGEPGDAIAGHVMVDAEPGPNTRARVGLFDSRGRELAHEILEPAELLEVLPPEPEEEPEEEGEEEPEAGPRLGMPFSFTVEPWMPMLLRVHAALYRNPPGPPPAEVIHSGYAYFRVTKRHQGRFNFLMWDTPRGTLAPYAERSLAENAVTLQLGHGNPSIILAANDIAWVPYTTRVMTPKTEDGIMQPFCWNDEEAVQAHVQEKAEAYLPSRQHGVFVWSLGDEVTTQGSCLSQHCAEAYREYLQEVYGSLDALNESWTTNFTDWSQVGLSQEGDNDEANSLAEGNYPRWFDRQAFQSYNFVQFCQAYDDAYTAIDPLAKTGFEGAGKFSAGDDLDLIIRENEFWSPYPGVADEVLRSIAPRDFPHANWMGYTKDADSLLQKYWRMVTRGSDAVWWWRWDCIGRFHGWLAPDLRPFPAVEEILRDTQIMRDGLGDLLLQSEMLDTEIAMLYSYPSTFACTVEEGNSYGSYTSSHVALHDALRDLGYQFRYVTDRMLRLGEFDAERFRMLLLPRAEAMGEEEAQVIRDYVAGGGVVIADVRPAIYDGHCKPLAEGLLDDLFGIETEGRAEASTVTVTIDAQPGLTFDAAKVDPTVRLTTGEAMGEADGTPVMIVNQVGEGTAVLLNFAANSFPKISVADTPEAAAEVLLALISRSGAHQPPLWMQAADGSRLRNIEAIRWRTGETEILALFRQSGNREEATVTLPEARHIYDLRNRRYLGRSDSFETTIIPMRATFLALLPEAVPPAELTVEPASVTRGSVATATLSVPGAEGLHGFKVTASAGDRKLDWLEQVVVTGTDPVEIAVPVAYNDPAGEYTITARELFSSEDTSATLEVE
ncbi:MAG: alpha-amylase family protein [Armatimonadota bacterium]|nr:alpha-amylase family protein [Armatimonadota bacterium]